jgi:hypothetical protein
LRAVTEAVLQTFKVKEPGNHHVVPSNGGGWDVRRGGADRASGHFDTKREAVDPGGRQVMSS